MKKRNAFYALVAERVTNRPDATPADHWRHFCRLAESGVLPLLAGIDGDALLVCLDTRNQKRICRRSFARNTLRIQQQK